MLNLFHPSLRRLSLWLDGALAPARAARVAAHVERCAHCRERLEPLRAMEPAFTPQPAPGPAGDAARRRARIMTALPEVARVEAPVIGEVHSIAGIVMISHGADAAREPLEAAAGMAVRCGDTLRAIGDSMALIALADGSHIYINKNSDIEFMSGETQAWLGAGELLAMMRPQAHPFRIKTPSATLAVLGTEFSATVMPDARTVLSVLKGRVAFENAAGRAIVARRRRVEAAAHTSPVPERLRHPAAVTAWARPLAESASITTSGGGSIMGKIVKWLAAFALVLAILAGLFFTFIYPKIVTDTALIPGQINPATGEKLLSENEALAIKRQIFPQAAVDAAWEIHEAALQRPLGAGEYPIPVNTQLNAIGPDKSIWLGVLSLYVNQSDSIVSGEIFRSNTSSDAVYYFDEIEQALPVRLQRDTSKPYKINSMFITLRNPVPPRNSRRHFSMTSNWGKLMALPGNRYNGRLHNHFGSEVLETLTLVLPKGWSLEVSSVQPTSSQQIGDFTLLAWQKRVPKDTDHTVDFTLRENPADSAATRPSDAASLPAPTPALSEAEILAAPSAQTAIAAARHAAATAPFEEQPYAGLAAGIRAIQTGADLLPLMPRLAREIPGYIETIAAAEPNDIKGRADKMARRQIERVERRDGPPAEGDLAYVLYRVNSTEPDIHRAVMIFEDGMWKDLHDGPAAGDAESDLARYGLVVRNFRLTSATEFQRRLAETIQRQLEHQRARN